MEKFFRQLIDISSIIYLLLQVWKAEAENICGFQGTVLVAVKTVKDNANAKEKQDILREMELMQKLGPHPNLVTLLGCCTKQGNYGLFYF